MVLSIAGLLLLPVAASLSKLVVALHRGVVMNLLLALDPVELARLDVQDRRAALTQRLDLAPELASLRR